MLNRSLIFLLTPLLLLPSRPTLANSLLAQFTPPPPPDVGEPTTGRERGGGTRSPECDRYANVAALVPSTPTGDRTVQWGLTTASHPTIWLSAPEGLEEGVAMEFALWNQAQLVHRSTYSTPATPAGSFSLTPTDAPALESGEVYYWTVSIFCDAETPDVPVTIGAHIQRTAVPEDWNATAEPLQQSATYARAGIWYDALTVLGDQYLEGGNGAIADAWTTLLQQANLSPILPVDKYCEQG